MAPLPNVDRAIIDRRKLEDYCLDHSHPRGRHKARVFRAALGIEKIDASWLESALLTGLGSSDAMEIGVDKFGVLWRVDITVTRLARSAVVRTIWIERHGSDEPRLVTCWVL